MLPHHNPNAHVTDMEAFFSVCHICATLIQCPPGKCHQPHQPGGTASARMHEGARTTSVVLVLHAPHHSGVVWDEQRGSQCPLCQGYFGKKKHKPPQCHQGVLRRFLAMLPVIGHNQVPNLNCAHPQGVNRDSLGSFTLLAGQQAGETVVLHAFFECTVSTAVLYVK